MLISLQVWCLHPFGTWVHGVHFLGLLHLNKCNLWFPSLSFPFLVTIWASLVAHKVKESACNARDLGLIPRLGRSPEEGNGYPVHYSYLENSILFTQYQTQNLWGWGVAQETTSFAMGLEKDRWRLEKYLECSGHRGVAGLKIKNCLPKYSQCRVLLDQCTKMTCCFVHSQFSAI